MLQDCRYCNYSQTHVQLEERIRRPHTCRCNVQVGKLRCRHALERVEVGLCSRHLVELQMRSRSRHSGVKGDVLHSPHALRDVVHQGQGALCIPRSLKELQQARE